MPVGIPYSIYWPLDDHFAIEEEFGVLVEKAATITDPFKHSLFFLIHIPYLQVFDDINKRTSQIVANIPLLKANLALMSFLTMDDTAYINGLLGIYELNDVSLLREIYIDAYIASAENYKVLRAQLEMPDKATLVYRDFVHKTVRRCVLEWKELRSGKFRNMAKEADIPETDLEQVIAYIGNEFRGLHEGNVIPYRLRIEDLSGIKGD